MNSTLNFCTEPFTFVAQYRVLRGSCLQYQALNIVSLFNTLSTDDIHTHVSPRFVCFQRWGTNLPSIAVCSVVNN